MGHNDNETIYNQYIVTIVGERGGDSVDKENALRHVLEGLGVDIHWVAVDPSPEYGHEHRHCEDDIWWDLEPMLQRLFADASEPMEWVGVPEPSQWDTDTRRRFIQYIVQRMGYLGPNGYDFADAVVGLGWARVATD